MRVRTNYLVSKFAFLTFPFLVAPISYLLLIRIFNIILFGTFLEISITFFAIILAIFTFFGNQRDSNNNKIEEQINVMDGLISELNIIVPNNQQSLQGNIYWYKKEIERNNPKGLDHPINRVHIENYISRLNGKYFNKTGFALISNINDKIYQLNHHILEENQWSNVIRDYCLSIIDKEVLPKIQNLRKQIDNQKQIILKDKI